ncbi:MAG TPA: cytochrome c [Tepidisphaeraceae bacterium]|nr:cytochrome c [Tepidisphaeraceae bacterium]
MMRLPFGRLALSAAVIAAISLTHLLATGCGSARRAEPRVGPIHLTEAQQLGQQVFSQHCYQCHPNGAAGVGPAINDKPLPQALIRAQVRAGLGAMPGFDEQHISDEELKAVSEYLSALRKAG